MDPLQWMGAVRMRVQTADKNITIIHTTPVHQLTSWEVKLCGFVRNKSNIKIQQDGLEWCGLLWCFYQLFGLSFWRHPFTAEHPLMSKWCNATFLQISWKNKLIYIFDVELFFFFWRRKTRIPKVLENRDILYVCFVHQKKSWKLIKP